MNICIVGGGNIGTLLAGELSFKGNKINILTSNPRKWNKIITVYNTNNKIVFSGKLNLVTNNVREAIDGCELIILTVPSFLFEQRLKEIKEYVHRDTLIAAFPGTGGKEFVFESIMGEQGCFFGLQRVHSISRLKEYGTSVYMTGRKDSVTIGSLNKKYLDKCAVLLENLLDMPCHKVENYLNVTLTPSNPILHTTRLYSLFKSSISKDYIIKFYEEWDDKASEMLFECDNELQLLCNSLKKIDLKNVISLKKHYAANTIQDFTDKIQSIEAFKGIEAPMVKNNGKYYVDWKSRYFEEDFPYGLCIVKSFCEIMNLYTPYIDKVLYWYEQEKKLEYYKDDHFNGKDLKLLNIPQNFGINNEIDINKFYNQ